MNDQDSGSRSSDARLRPRGDRPSTGGEFASKYVIKDLIGSGTFGDVYLAEDVVIGRDVAIKFLKKRFLSDELFGGSPAKRFREEARKLGRFNHDGIVRVYDAGETEDGRLFIVTEFIEGADLDKEMERYATTKARVPKFEWTATVIAQVAGALAYIHSEGVIHRDLKPPNIRIDTDGRARLMDFGLAYAVDSELLSKRRGHLTGASGTRRYMSPEQVRGAGKITGGSDIFSLGVILYELLTGAHPFEHQDDIEALLEKIENEDPMPPRERNSSVPSELSRICICALAKERQYRYPSAAHMSEDLHRFLNAAYEERAAAARALPPDSEPQSTASSRVVPAGFRSFTEDDSHFFLKLLPGTPSYRDLPPAIEFWKRRIEKSQAPAPLRVGVLHGPVGSGKSSLLLAGLVPSLAVDKVKAVVVRATKRGPEDTLRTSLLQTDQVQLCDSQTLADLFFHFRRKLAKADKKCVLIVDQFEQWLMGDGDSISRLAEALQQCDGKSLCCILSVRDELLGRLRHFMKAVDAPYEEDTSYPLEAFETKHAQRVLELYGHSTGKFDPPEGVSDSQHAESVTRFIRDASNALARPSGIVCIRLSMFFELNKHKSWACAREAKLHNWLHDLERKYFEQKLGDNCNPRLKPYSRAAHRVLRALCPDPPGDTANKTLSVEELCRESRCCAEEFEQVTIVLDQELRLITPTDIDEAESGYRLSHDFLVTPLRHWLDAQLEQLPTGRASLCLKNRTSLWLECQKDRRQLPTLGEYAEILRWTSKREWSSESREMMSISRSLYLRKILLAVAIGIAVFCGWREYSKQVMRRQVRDAVEYAQSLTGSSLDEGIDRLSRYPTSVLIDELEASFDRASLEHKKSIAYYLSQLGIAKTEFLVERIEMQLTEADDSEYLIAALTAASEQSKAVISSRLAELDEKEDFDVKCLLAFTAFQLGETSAFVELSKGFKDPDLRTRIITTLGLVYGDPRAAANAARTLEADDAIYNLIAGLAMAWPLSPEEMKDPNLMIYGGQRMAEWNRRQINNWEVLLTDWYLNSKDAGVRGASKSLLMLWGIGLPPHREKDPSQVDSVAYALERGPKITLVRVSAGEFVRSALEIQTLTPISNLKLLPRLEEQVSVDYSFWISDTEVTIGQYFQFLQDTGREPLSVLMREIAAGMGENTMVNAQETDVMQVAGVDWIDSMPFNLMHPIEAIEFCNWLSDMEELTRCYTKMTPSDVLATQSLAADIELAYQSDTSFFVLDTDANGYRLPSDDEWELACRAGSTTPLSIGVDTSALGSFAVYDVNRPTSVARRLPNRLGLFDCHGNAMELCTTTYPRNWTDQSVWNFDDRWRIYSGRGGDFKASVLELGASQRVLFSFHPDPRRNNSVAFPFLGFRIVRMTDEPGGGAQ